MIKRAKQNHQSAIGGEMRKSNLPGTVKDWRKIFTRRTGKCEQEIVAATSEEKTNKATKQFSQNQLPEAFQIHRRENPRDYERTAFVCRACVKSATELFKTVVHVERARIGSRLVASDGRRLHVAHIRRRIASGDYKAVVGKDFITMRKTEDIVNYPNWFKVVPTVTSRLGSIDLSGAAFRKNRNETEKLSIAFNSFIQLTGVPVNLRFLEDLTKKEWSVHGQGSRGKPVLLYEDGSERQVYAVIVPILHVVPESAVSAEFEKAAA